MLKKLIISILAVKRADSLNGSTIY